MSVADRFVCLLEGRISLQGAPGGYTADDLSAAYFGT